MNTDHERQAWLTLRAAQAVGVDLDLGTCRRLTQHRFAPEWVPLLVDRIAGTQAANPEAVLAKWMRGREWQTQMLFVIATRIGLWDTLSDGGRFNRCRALRGEGMLPWILAALWSGAQREDSITQPRAFLGSLLKHGRWVRFHEEIELAESARDLTSPAVVSVVRSVIRAQMRKLATVPATTPDSGDPYEQD